MANAGDRDNFSGDLVVTAPTGGHTRGLIYVATSGAYGVARATVDAAAVGVLAVFGAVWATKLTGAITAGQKIYQDSSTKKASTASTGNVLVGYAAKAAASGDTEVLVVMGGLPVTAS